MPAPKVPAGNEEHGWSDASVASSVSQPVHDVSSRTAFYLPCHRQRDTRDTYTGRSRLLQVEEQKRNEEEELIKQSG